MDIPLLVVYCVLILGGILPFVFRRYLWIRGLCVCLILIATLFGFGRFWVSGRMAVYRFEAEQKQWNASARDGSFYTWRAASSALPVFAVALLALSAMAVIPPRQR